MMTRMRRKLLATTSGAGLLLLVLRGSVQAFAMGIPLDAFIQQLATSITGLGFIVGLIGLVGVVYSKMETQYGQLASGFLPYFVNAGMLGGGATLIGAVGLTAGALLVL